MHCLLYSDELLNESLSFFLLGLCVVACDKKEVTVQDQRDLSYC